MAAANAYIIGLGAHLPGPAIDNDRMGEILGIVKPGLLKIGRKVLRQNGIRHRHYGLDENGQPATTNARLAAEAARTALRKAGQPITEIDFLAAASSQGDMIAPGHASAVHGELGGRPMDLASFTSFCASGMMALKAATANVLSGMSRKALVCASEFASRFLRQDYLDGAASRVDTEFLRWTLSDGAGAAIVADRPAEKGLSLRIDYIDLISYADRMPTCMYGGVGNEDTPDRSRPWSQFPSLKEAVEDGAFHLRQDLKLLDQIVPVGLSRCLELMEQGHIDPAGVDWALCHFSSHVFRERMVQQAARMDVPINQDNIFTNLYDKGNTGSAAIYIMLEELMASGRARPGQKILCMVPESGRFIISFMMLTVVGEHKVSLPAIAAPLPVRRTAAPVIPVAEPVPASTSSLVRHAAAGLLKEWAAFEVSLHDVELVRRLHQDRLTMQDYCAWLMNIRQQVVDGSRWIARAASSIELDDIEVRSAFVRHAGSEHRDYTLLEDDFVACGGDREDIRAGRKNAGSAALSAWMFQQASRENPFHLLGAMFIIESLGHRLAPQWAAAAREQLQLDDDQCRFLIHHAHEDGDHIGKLWSLMERLPLTEDLVAEIVETARVTARLYRLQLEEIDLS